MKTLLYSVAVMLLFGLFFAACGHAGDSDNAAPVDDWVPLVQGLPGHSALEFQAIEPASPVTLSSEEWLVYNYNPELGRLLYHSLNRKNEVFEFVRAAGRGSDVRNSFGGMYIDHGTGLLRVNIITENHAEELLQFLSGMENISVQSIEFTHSDLAYAAFLTRVALGFSPLAHSWVGIDFDINRVFVILRDYNEEEKDYFRREVFDSPMLAFRASPGGGWSSEYEIAQYAPTGSSAYWGRRSFNER